MAKHRKMWPPRRVLDETTRPALVGDEPAAPAPPREPAATAAGAVR